MVTIWSFDLACLSKYFSFTGFCVDVSSELLFFWLTLWLLGVSAGRLVGSCLLPGVRRLQHVRSDMARRVALLSRQLLRPDSDYSSLQTQTDATQTKGRVTPERPETWSASFRPRHEVLLDLLLKIFFSKPGIFFYFMRDQPSSVSIIG